MSETTTSTTVAPASLWRVVVFGKPDERQELADALAQRLGLHPTDALQHAGLAPGVLPDRLPELVARGLVDDLRTIGLSATAIPEAELPHLEGATRAHHVRCLDEGLEILGLHGERTDVVAWNSLRLISVGVVPEESVRRGDPTGNMAITTAPNPPMHSRQYAATDGPEAWLFAVDPPRLLRIDHVQMNYEYLGEKKTTSAATNFRLLLDDIVRRAPQAHRTPATRAWLEHLPAERYRFASSLPLQRDTLLHWAMVTHGE